MAGSDGVVVHVTTDDDAAWKQALRNVSNLLADETVSLAAERIAVVMNGGAVHRLVEATDDELADITDAGVIVSACANTISNAGLDETALPDRVVVVPSGVGEAVRRQRAGAAYLRLP